MPVGFDGLFEPRRVERRSGDGILGLADFDDVRRVVMKPLALELDVLLLRHTKENNMLGRRGEAAQHRGSILASHPADPGLITSIPQKIKRKNYRRS